MTHSPSSSVSSPPSHGFHPFHGHISKHLHSSSPSDSPPPPSSATTSSLHHEGSHNPDEAYLSYYDIRVTYDDFNSIRDQREWLTDNAISWWEEYLEHEVLPQYPQARICLLRPSMCFMLMQTPDDQVLGLKSALPDFTSYTHIFLPINDSTSPNAAESGSHWTLLLVSLPDAMAFHYDSLFPSNSKPAHAAAQKLSIIANMPAPLRFVDLEEAPQQHNGSDCGMFVCLNMKELLMKRLLVTEMRGRVDMSLKGEKVEAREGRKEMVRILEGLRRKAMGMERRDSGSQSPPRIGPHGA